MENESFLPVKAALALQELIDWYTALAQSISEKKYAEGRLKISANHGRSQFYLVHNGKRKYLKKGLMPLIRQYAQKGYEQRLLKKIAPWLETLEDMRTAITAGDPVLQTQQALYPARKELIELIHVPDSAFVAAWKAVPFSKMAVDSDEFRTDNGEFVRSKSELIIANELFKAGVPYRYEYPVVIAETKKQLRPDFFCLNVRTRQQFAWEHFGMMQKPDYQDKAFDKIQLYRMHKVMPDCEFICTQENLSRPLNVTYVKYLIKTYLK
ncbi:MAG: hypothetical protein KBT02_02260 [Treponema sp.]|nr:hypothetical protein [Candidatus Treponema caballi]